MKSHQRTEAMNEGGNMDLDEETDGPHLVHSKTSRCRVSATGRFYLFPAPIQLHPACSTSCPLLPSMSSQSQGISINAR